MTLPRRRFSCLVVGVVALAMFSRQAEAQVARLEVHALPSLTLTDQQILLGARDGTAVMLAGELRIPRPGNDKLPAVILLQASGGFGANLNRWLRELNEMDVATFALDSFAGRGIVTTNTDQDQLARLAMMFDAYRALDLLSRHPRIDASRIAVMGFSRSGQSALYASMKRFQKMYAPAGVGFAAYLPLYAACNTTYMKDIDVSAKPIRQFHGSADDYVPVAPCRSYFERLKTAGADAVLTEYANVYHVFDNPALPTKPTPQPRIQTTRNCVLKEAPMGEIVNVKTGKPFTHLDSCVELEPNMAHDANATEATVSAVKAILRSTFKLN